MSGIWLIRNDDFEYDTNYDALAQDLLELGTTFSMRDFAVDIAEQFDVDSGALMAIWYRGGPGDSDEPQSPPRPWTGIEIDNYIQLLDDGHAVLLMSQAHGYGKGAFFPETTTCGWEAWWGNTILDAQLQPAQARHMWAHGLTGGRGVTGTGEYGYLASEPLAMSSASIAGGKIPSDGYDLDGMDCAERYNGPGSSGKLPLELWFGYQPQICALGYSSGMMLLDANPVAAAGFCPGMNISPPFEAKYDLGFISWGSTTAPNRNMGVYGEGGQQVNLIDHGKARLWVIGYPWAQTEVIASANGGMQRADLLYNIIGWLTKGGTYPDRLRYSGPPEIVQVMVGNWEAGGYHYDSLSYTWDGTAGDYPDQTAAAGYDVNVYRTEDAGGNYVVTSSPNNDWINGNDIDFQFPWYAYIVDVDSDGVQTGAGNLNDDTAFFGGLLLQDADASWQRDMSLSYYGENYGSPDDNVPSCVIDGFDPPVRVAGYYVATQPDTGDEVRAYYGAAPASVTIDNMNEITAECVAHWPPTLYYGGFEYPAGSGNELPISEPVLYWSMYPGHNILVPGTAQRIPHTSPDGWDTYRRAFDIDPSVSVSARDLGSAWNRPQFDYIDAASGGRVVTFDYRRVDRWNPDLNRDGVIDNLDKFPVRVRLFTDHEDYLNWPAVWPNHLPDPGFDPELGGPIWDPNDPGFNIPDYIEGGAYIIDEGSRVIGRMIVDDPSQPDPDAMVVGSTGSYNVTFSYMIISGEAPYTIDLQLGFDFNDIGLGETELDVFGDSGETHYAIDTYPSRGAYSTVMNVILPDGEYWAAARVTDNLGDQDVYVWAISKVPLYPQD